MRVEQIGDATLYLGDALEILPTLSDVAAVITDPPYCSGARTSADVRGRSGMSRGELWKSKPLPNDRMTVTGFVWMMRQVAMAAEDVLIPGGSFLCFIDWRQYPTLYGVVESANLRVQTMVVWDKESMALGNGFRNQHELIIHAAKDSPNVYNRAVPNVLRHKRISASTQHPTEKPVGLMETLVSVVTDSGNLVVDPFMGSGTTGCACLSNGRKFIGVERDAGYFDVACLRLDGAYKQSSINNSPAPRPVQQPGLFAETAA